MTHIAVNFSGPFSWPGYEALNGLPPLPNHAGLYLWTADYEGGYIIYGAGLTRRTFVKRFKEHTREYFKGEYTVLDISSMQRGKRLEIWHGWGWTSEKRKLYEVGSEIISEAVEKQLQGFRIFVADIEIQERIFERLEASIMNCLYSQTSPFSSLPDRGMQLSPRWKNEVPITAVISASSKLYGLPSRLEI